MGLTSPHQMDPLCLSTRRHWVHWVSGSLLGIPYQGGVFCLFVFVRFFCFALFFPALVSPSRVWMLGRQLIAFIANLFLGLIPHLLGLHSSE